MLLPSRAYVTIHASPKISCLNATTSGYALTCDGQGKGGGGAGRPDPDEVSPETHQNAVSRGSTSDVELH